MRKECSECGWFGGDHHWSCQTRGYQNVGPHPDAPAKPNHADEALRRYELTDMCCGGTRQRKGCEYHDPALQPAQVAPDTERLTFGRYEAELTYDLQRPALSWLDIKVTMPGRIVPVLVGDVMFYCKGICD